MIRRSVENLFNLGFRDIAVWMAGDSAGGIVYQIYDADRLSINVLLQEKRSLYAFIAGEEVMYIGKTARSIRERLSGYRAPNVRQRTNWRCNGKIRETLAAGKSVRILVFNPISHLRYGEFELNIAAGLEDSLIEQFDPPWNGRERGQPISEEAERETIDEFSKNSEEDLNITDFSSEVILKNSNGIEKFEIRLGDAYYKQGIINPGVRASEHLVD
ncbi:GIY-YIG nuclease family protein [Labrys sp. ZIDIC5]|uniref:GIY-YIG nuclease family protein n=1 Tax=Labrys sedimenti TaxID=3106036 RepID=UPI002ACA7B8A|nr:GIY-YIG nuclease family protein [Labrys sp. ZIDIC5]MDZ5452872.1 GIY-YIG nuclease family protein [Labrys sp. ZIDIC5]